MAEQTEKINCSICLSDFTEPKTIDCGHQFCVKCLEDYVCKVGKDNLFPCPLCRQDAIIPDGGIRNFPSSSSCVNTESESINSTTPNCDACKRKKKSNFHCLDCQSCFCAACKTPHDFFFSDHRVSKLGHSRNAVDGGQPFCSRHTTENVEFYCKDCCQIICKECQISDHKDHDSLEINLYGKEAMADLKNLKTEYENKMAEMTNYVDHVNKKISVINTSAATSCAKIDEQVKTICEAVTKRGCEFKADVQNARQKEERKMKMVVESSKKIIDELEESVDNINIILKGDSMYDVLDELPTLRSQWQENEARELINLYDVSTEFHLGKINTTTLDEMIGNIEMTQSVMITHNFESSEVTDVWRFSPVYKVEDRLWHFKVRKNKCLNLGMMVYGENLASGKTKVTMKLIENYDVNRSVFGTPTFSTPSLTKELTLGTGNNDVNRSIFGTQTRSIASLTKELTWDTGRPAYIYGNNGQFTVQATIIIVKGIKTYQCYL
ncbi:hypothetical protein SNE40_016168 [Patella caerulea]|uniref:TRIM56 n=1 Tax=Patella caerulea TaxID=87958 RepID=A0AAN8JCP0_PATCE